MQNKIAKSFKLAAAGMTFLFACGTAQATVVVPPTPNIDFGALVGSDTKSALLPDGDPNVAWYQFVLTAASLVELNTFNSEVSDTTLALYDDAGTVLGQNDDCASPSSFQSCLAFSKLEAGTYLAGIAKFATSFVDLWMVENNELSSDGTTLNITITQIPVSAVPVPAAIWLFGTALIGFVGMSRRISVKS